MSRHLTDEQLDEIEVRAAHLYEYEEQPEEADILAGTDVPALVAEVRRQRDRIAALQRDAEILSALEAAGVDGWDGYSNAMQAVKS